MSARPWFRFYTEAVFDRKLRRLAPEVRWLFVVVLSLARKSPRAGYLMLTDRHPMLSDDIYDAAAMKTRAVDEGMRQLVDVGILGWDEEVGAWFVPRWDERQYESDSSTERVKRHRERKRNVSRNVPESDQRQKTDTDTDTPLSPPGGGTEVDPGESCAYCDRGIYTDDEGHEFACNHTPRLRAVDG